MGNEESQESNSFCGKNLLSIIRSGDYAHAGEEEAIDILIENLPSKNSTSNETNNKPVRLLDVGCGLGATAEFMRKHHFSIADEVNACDIDPNAVLYGKQKFPKCNFFVADVLQLDKKTEMKFDVVTMFNVIYCVKDQQLCLKKIFDVTNQGGQFCVFEYTNKVGLKNRLYRDDKDWSPFVPLEIPKFEKMAKLVGWKIEKVLDLSDEYERWYEQFMQNMERKKKEIISKFNEPIFQGTKFSYQTILDSIKSKETGGALIYLSKN